MSGVGQGQVQVGIGPQGFTFTETGRFVIPLPGTLALFALGLAPFVVRRQR